MRPSYAAILWWEKRRLQFNAIVLAVAALSFAVIEGVGSQLVQPGEDVVEPLAVIAGGALFIIGANLCYTLGWITELMWSGGDTSRTADIRQKVYRRGLVFSVLVAAAPGALVPVMWIVFGFH